MIARNIYDSVLPEYQAFSEHGISMTTRNIYDSVFLEYQAISEHAIFMIACCQNIKPLVSI